MPRLYKVLTAVLALTGCVSLVVTGEVNPVMAMSGLAIFPGYYRFLAGRPHAGKWTIGTFSLAALGVFFFDAAVSGDAFLAVAHLTIAFQAIKSFDLKEPWDHLQVYFVSLLQLIIASELTDSVAFGAIFVLFLVLLVAAMVLSHFLKEGHAASAGLKRPVIVISLLTLFSTLFLFVAIPRASFKILGKSHLRAIKTTGFSNSMSFGSFGSVKLDPTIAMRVEIQKDAAAPYYWRGITFDHFDGLNWKNSLENTLKRRFRGDMVNGEYVFSPFDRKGAIAQKIYLEPMDSDVIFGLTEVKAVEVDWRSLTTDAAGSIYLPGKSSRRIQYTVYSVPSDDSPGVADRRYLQLPAGMSRIAGLARRITSGARTDAEKALSIERYLRANYTYSLSTTRPPEGVSPIEYFLFNTRKGYCEHYATSMALMLRCLGIPSRTVNGFHGGEENEYGGYIIVRESDAHSWVEALINGSWKRFDPTPSVPSSRPAAIALFLDSLRMNWARYVVGFSSTDQLSILRTISLPFALPRMYAPKLRDIPAAAGGCVIAVIILLSAGGWFLLRIMRFRRYGFVTKRYLDLRRLLRRRGLAISDTTTPADLRAAAGDGSRKLVEEFLALYEECRFGNREMSPEKRKKYETLLMQIRKSS